jgi:hypothetical protein
MVSTLARSQSSRPCGMQLPTAPWPASLQDPWGPRCGTSRWRRAMTCQRPTCTRPRSSARRSTSSPSGRSRASPGVRHRDRPRRAPPGCPERAGGWDRAVGTHGGRAAQQARRRRHPGVDRRHGHHRGARRVQPGLSRLQRHPPACSPRTSRWSASATPPDTCSPGAALSSRSSFPTCSGCPRRDRPTLPCRRAPPGIRPLRPSALHATRAPRQARFGYASHLSRTTRS